MVRNVAFAVSAATLAFSPVAADAATVIVEAAANSSTGGTGKVTGFTFSAGQFFRVRSSTNDLWRAGALPRFSDANGLIGDRFATADDDSGQPIGTQIGINFGQWTQDGFSAPFGSLVGRYADGTYQLLGANFTGAAAGNGDLRLFYWDSNNFDNSGEITFQLLAGVPEPTTWAMMILGFGVVGGAMRRRKAQTKVAVRYA